MDDGSGSIGEIAARVEAIVGQLRERPGDRGVEAVAEPGERSLGTGGGSWRCA